MPHRKSRKHWDPRRGDPAWQKRAEQVIRESDSIPDFAYVGDLPVGKTWALTFSRNRDSELLEISNFESIKADLESRFGGDVTEERFSHWAVGWVDHLLVRMLDDAGTVTPAGVAVLEWREALKGYPVADDEDYTRREYEATIENIKYAASVTDDEASYIYGWLGEHEEVELEMVDERGAWPSDESLRRAKLALGLEEPEEGEEVPPPPPYYDPAQTWLWPEYKPVLEE